MFPLHTIHVGDVLDVEYFKEGKQRLFDQLENLSGNIRLTKQDEI